MTCREVADTSLSDLAGLAQYCSISLRSQLRKQHSSTIPRFWVRRLLPLLVGLPEEEHNRRVRKGEGLASAPHTGIKNESGLFSRD